MSQGAIIQTLQEELAEDLKLLRSGLLEGEFQWLKLDKFTTKDSARWDDFIEDTYDFDAFKRLRPPAFSVRVTPVSGVIPVRMNFVYEADYNFHKTFSMTQLPKAHQIILTDFGNQLAEDLQKEVTRKEEERSAAEENFDDDEDEDDYEEEAERHEQEYPIYNLCTGIREFLASDPFPPIPAKALTLSKPAAKSVIELKFKEVLLWAHHLLSTEKRKNIIKWGSELKLFGLSKPGYPGVIWIEGLKSGVDEFVRRIKELNWKALHVRHSVTSEAIIPPAKIAPNDHEDWVLKNHCKIGKNLGKIGIEEVEGMSEVADKMKKAGLEDAFLTVLKISK